MKGALQAVQTQDKAALHKMQEISGEIPEK
jgi:hypothetical protein